MKKDMSLWRMLTAALILGLLLAGNAAAESGNGSVQERASLMIGVWGRFVSERTAAALTADFKKHCDEQRIQYEAVSFRFYDGARRNSRFYRIAAYSAQILKDKDVDVVIPVARNIDTQESSAFKGTGDIKVKKPLTGVNVVGPDGKETNDDRMVASLNADPITQAFLAYCDLPRARKILDPKYNG
ncbi:MAG: hypothetical protein LBU16_08670 [Treponema sp.]|nr:hypothetical protein [Treponema sp.]